MISPFPPRTRPSFGLRLWRTIASPWWTLLLLILLALAGTLSLLLPQAEVATISSQRQWLATLQGRYGRWTEFLNGLGLFDIAHALWLQVLLTLTAFQGLVAAAEGCSRAWHWLHLRAGAPPQLPPSHIRRLGLPPHNSSLTQGMAQVQSALQRLGYRVRVAQSEGRALVEAVRCPWLTLGRPLAHGGVVLACVAGLLGGRLDWQERPIVLCPGQSYELRHAAGMVLRLEEVGLARSSSQLYSWVSLLRDEQALCTGVTSQARGLRCAGIHILQGKAGQALRIAGHDRTGHPLSLQSPQSGEETLSEVTIPLSSDPFYCSVALPKQGLQLNIEASTAQEKPIFQVEVQRVKQGAPLLQRETMLPTSLALDDLTLALSPMQVPSFEVYHYPTRPFGWAGLSLTLVGLLMGLALLSLHLWVHIEEREDTVYLYLLQQRYSLPSWVPTPQEIESQMSSSHGSSERASLSERGVACWGDRSS